MTAPDNPTQVDPLSLLAGARNFPSSTTPGILPVSRTEEATPAPNQGENDVIGGSNGASLVSFRGESLTGHTSLYSSPPRRPPQPAPSVESVIGHQSSDNGTQATAPDTGEENPKPKLANRALDILSGLRARFGSFGYHHLLMIFLFIAIVLSSVLVAGCSSSGLRNVYLISLSYENSSATQAKPLAQLNPSFFDDVANLSSTASLEVRVGYFGLCVRPGEEDWSCATDPNILARTMNGTQDPLNLLWAGSRFQNQAFLSVLIVISTILALLVFLLLSTFPGWHDETAEDGSIHQEKPFPSKGVTRISLGMSSLVSILLLVAVLWQHVAAVAQSTTVQAIFERSVKTQVGTASMALGWTAVCLNALTSIFQWIMVRSIDLLTRLVDGDE